MYTTIILPINSKAKCRESWQPYPETRNSNGICEKCSPEIITTDQIPKVQKSTRKNSKKIKEKLIEKVVSCEFEEESITGQKTLHRYICCFSDPHNIKELIQTKKFQPIEKFQA